MIPAVLLTLLVLAYRAVMGVAGSGDLHWLHNFSPLAAVVLCGAAFFPRRVALVLPFGALLISDGVLNVHYGLPLVAPHMGYTYPALALVAALGWTLRQRASAGLVVGAAVAGSLMFYVVTNTGSWWGQAAYPQTLAGLIQALTTGLPGLPPTWVFFRNSLASDLFFTLLFLACMALGQRRVGAVQPAGAYPEAAAELEG